MLTVEDLRRCCEKAGVHPAHVRVFFYMQGQEHPEAACFAKVEHSVTFHEDAEESENTWRVVLF